MVWIRFLEQRAVVRTMITRHPRERIVVTVNEILLGSRIDEEAKFCVDSQLWEKNERNDTVPICEERLCRSAGNEHESWNDN